MSYHALVQSKHCILKKKTYRDHVNGCGTFLSAFGLSVTLISNGFQNKEVQYCRDTRSNQNIFTLSNVTASNGVDPSCPYLPVLLQVFRVLEDEEGAIC